ncbi:MAG: hypothetical protein ACRC1L_09270, partial [Prochlorococcaceae cyanobacterium]
MPNVGLAHHQLLFTTLQSTTRPTSWIPNEPFRIIAKPCMGPEAVKETLENPATLRENGRVIAGVDRLH